MQKIKFLPANIIDIYSPNTHSRQAAKDAGNVMAKKLMQASATTVTETL